MNATRKGFHKELLPTRQEAGQMSSRRSRDRLMNDAIEKKITIVMRPKKVHFGSRDPLTIWITVKEISFLNDF